MIDMIPVFYACDDSFAKYTMVSIRSLIDNADKGRQYAIYILNIGISEETKAPFYKMQTDDITISFVDVSDYFNHMSSKLPIRDYYSKSTYYRLIIADMFPTFNKAIYIDSDTVVLGDISELYDTDIGDSYLAAGHEHVMIQTDVFGTYVEQVMGIDRNAFFNAGLLLINCRMFRAKKLLAKFSALLNTYNFRVTQDEDYLNVICKDRVFWLDQKWNCEVYGEIPCLEDDIKIVHYIMTSKPWHYSDCKLGGYFWKYAGKTPVYAEIKAELDGYTDRNREADRVSGERLAELAKSEIERDDNYIKCVRRRQDAERVAITEKIKKLEAERNFIIDAENDPPAPKLEYDRIDYLQKGITKKFKTLIAYSAASVYVKKLTKTRKLIISGIIGIENLEKLNTGAILTCNHFNAYDSFAMSLAYNESKQKKSKFYRVIREGNYTGFPGFYGFLMRNCNTLPLSSSTRTMGKFVRDVGTLLQEGNFVLIYPEQSMWWNYRKPKPLQDGAFTLAAKNGVPVLPCFITMKDSDILDDDGFYVQEYTIHIGKPLVQNTKLSQRERVADMKQRNFEIWKEIYESSYGIPLTYGNNSSSTAATV